MCVSSVEVQPLAVHRGARTLQCSSDADRCVEGTAKRLHVATNDGQCQVVVGGLCVEEQLTLARDTLRGKRRVVRTAKGLALGSHDDKVATGSSAIPGANAVKCESVVITTEPTDAVQRMSTATTGNTEAELAVAEHRGIVDGAGSAANGLDTIGVHVLDVAVAYDRGFSRVEQGDTSRFVGGVVPASCWLASAIDEEVAHFEALLILHVTVPVPIRTTNSILTGTELRCERGECCAWVRWCTNEVRCVHEQAGAKGHLILVVRGVQVRPLGITGKHRGRMEQQWEAKVETTIRQDDLPLAIRGRIHGIRRRLRHLVHQTALLPERIISSERELVHAKHLGLAVSRPDAPPYHEGVLRLQLSEGVRRTEYPVLSVIDLVVVENRDGGVENFECHGRDLLLFVYLGSFPYRCGHNISSAYLPGHAVALVSLWSHANSNLYCPLSHSFRRMAEDSILALIAPSW